VDRHQPQDRDAEFSEAVELARDAVEVPFRREGARVDFVDDAVPHPIAHGPRLLARHVALRLRRDAGRKRREQQRERDECANLST
jgi:hypothetical protein